MTALWFFRSVFILAFILFLVLGALARPRYLIIHSGHPDDIRSLHFQEGLASILNDHGLWVQHYFMNANRQAQGGDEEYRRVQERIRRQLDQMLASWDPELVVAMDLRAQLHCKRLRLAENGTRVIYCGVDLVNAREFKLYERARHSDDECWVFSPIIEDGMRDVLKLCLPDKAMINVAIVSNYHGELGGDLPTDPVVLRGFIDDKKTTLAMEAIRSLSDGKGFGFVDKYMTRSLDEWNALLDGLHDDELRADVVLLPTYHRLWRDQEAEECYSGKDALARTMLRLNAIPSRPGVLALGADPEFVLEGGPLAVADAPRSIGKSVGLQILQHGRGEWGAVPLVDLKSYSVYINEPAYVRCLGHAPPPVLRSLAEASSGLY